MGQRLSLGWVFVATVALAGCSTQSSTIQLRSPEGSSLTFRNAEGGDLARVSFPGEVTLPDRAHGHHHAAAERAHRRGFDVRHIHRDVHPLLDMPQGNASVE